MLLAANPIRTGAVTMKSPKSVAQSAQSPVVAMRLLIKRRVNVTTESGAKHSYTALFPSTCDAAIDALDRFGIAKISAGV